MNSMGLLYEVRAVASGALFVRFNSELDLFSPPIAVVVQPLRDGVDRGGIVRRAVVPAGDELEAAAHLWNGMRSVLRG